MQDLIHLHVSSSRRPTIPWKEEPVLLGLDSLWGPPAASQAASCLFQHSSLSLSLSKPVLNLLNLREKASPLTQGEF